MVDLALYDVFISSLRWLIGLIIGASFGFIIGALLSFKNVFSKPIVYSFDFLRAIPILGLVPVIQFYFGIDESGKILLIAWATMFPIAIGVQNSVKEMPLDTVAILKSSSVNKIDKFSLIIIRGAIDGVFKAVNIAIGIAWLVVVAAEMIGTYTTGFWRGGLGYQLFQAYEYNDPTTMFLILGIFGLLGTSTSLVWRVMFKQFSNGSIS